MIDGFEIQKRYENLPHGEQRLQAIKNAIALADAEKDYEFMYIFRSDLMSESELYGDSFQAFLTFPEMIKFSMNTKKSLRSTNTTIYGNSSGFSRTVKTFTKFQKQRFMSFSPNLESVVKDMAIH